MKARFSSTVAGAAILLSVVGILTRGLGFIREIIFAGYFGLSSEFDMYLVGAVLPVTISTIIIYLGQNYLIPAANKIRVLDNELMENFLRMNFFIFILGGIIIAGILFLLSELIIGTYLHLEAGEIYDTTIFIFRLYLITIPLSCAISVLSAYNQIKYRFNFPAYSNLILNLSYIILVFFFAKSLGIFIIPLGFIAGSIIQVIYLLKKTELKYSIVKISYSHFREYFPTTLMIIILIESIGQLYLLADRYFWNYVPEGGLAALNYAQTLFLLPVLILSIALSTAIFPKLSEMISRNLISDLENTFSRSVRINITLFLPITFILMYYGGDLITFLFERGRFLRSDTIITHNALKYYAISLLFYAIYSVANKLVYGLGYIRELLYITIAGILLKIILNYLLVPQMEQNGLALSTSVSFIFFTVAGMYLIHKRITIIKKNIYIQEFWFQSINLISAFCLVKLFSILIPFKGSALFEMVLFSLLILFNIMFLKHSAWNTLVGIIPVQLLNIRNLKYFGNKNV